MPLCSTTGKRVTSTQAGWGDLFDRAVDAALSTAGESFGRDDVVQHLDAGTLIPGRYLYMSDLGARNWRHLCRDPMYRHHRETFDFWSSAKGQDVADVVQACIGCDDIDFISLGPGAGEKDAEIVRHWIASGIDVFYYPYDVSRWLLSEAARAVRDSAAPGSGLLRMKAVLADFSEFRHVRAVFDYRPSPNVISLLGNLGNLDGEFQFLKRLALQMDERDVLLLEVRLRTDDGPPMELRDGDAALRFDFGALESYLGLPFNRSSMTIEHHPNISSIADTLTTVVGCRDVRYRDKTYDHAKLLYIHQYTLSTFLAALGEAGLRVVTKEVGGVHDDFLVCVVQRRFGRRSSVQS